MRNLSNVSLLDTLPPNLRNDEKVKVAAQAIDAELKKITDKAPHLTLYYYIDQLEEEWVDELAWQERVDFYDATLPIEQKRELVDNSLSWKSRKGSASVVEELVTTIFGDGEVEEWFEYGGLPYHFRVKTTNPAATNEQAQEFILAVESVKRKSTRLDDVILIMTDDMNLYFGGVLYMGDHLTIEQVV